MAVLCTSTDSPVATITGAQLNIVSKNEAFKVVAKEGDSGPIFTCSGGDDRSSHAYCLMGRTEWGVGISKWSGSNPEKTDVQFGLKKVHSTH